MLNHCAASVDVKAESWLFRLFGVLQLQQKKKLSKTTLLS
jgi:hypothetical protein